MKLKDNAPIVAQAAIALIVMLILLSLVSCTAKKIVQKEVSGEKVRIEYREILRTDTVTVQLPPERMEVIRRDSSRLETSLAISDARIQPDGTIYHTLENKPFSPKIEVRYKDRETVRDSIVYRAKEIPYPVEKDLNWWQKLRMKVGGIALIVLILASAYKIFRILKR